MAEHELAVIEGRWFEESNRSVRPVFDTLIDLLYDTPHAYFHHQFSNAASLEHVIRHVADSPAKFLYIGAHGDSRAVYGSLGGDRGRVTRAELRTTLFRCWDEDMLSFDGLFLGSCSFVTETNAKYMLCGDNAPRRLRWMAGYSKKVDWIDSTLLDSLFLKRVLEFDDGTPLERVKHAAGFVQESCLGLAEGLGFNVYVRKLGPGGGVKPLLEY
jgi:hypothetical protein